MKTLLTFILCLTTPFVFANSFVEQTLLTLPESFLGVIKRDIKVEFTKLDNFSQIQNPCGSHGSQQIFGKTQNGKIFINRNFIPYLNSNGEKKDFDCGHKNFKKLAVATLIHELAHLYDDVKKISDDSHYISLSHRKKTIVGTDKVKNRKTERLPDAYELKNTEEHFAVNMEFFLLDPNYTCHRPNLGRYFSKILKIKVKDCDRSTKARIFNDENSFEVEINTSSIKSIHYLLADEGSAAMSKFGHSMFLLKTDSEKNDLVVGFSGQMDGTVIDGLEGLTGKYASRIMISPFNKVHESYTKTQWRGLTAYQMNLTESEISIFLNEVLTLYWEYSGRYYFFTNNCATEALDLLKATISKKSLHKKTVLSPLGLRKVLSDEGLISEESKLYYPSYRQRMEKIFDSIEEIRGLISFVEFIKLTASERKKIILSKSFNKRSLYSLLSLELSISTREAKSLENTMLMNIHRLEESDPIKKASSKAVKLSNELSFGFNVATGYGIPKESDYDEKSSDEYHDKEKELSEIFQMMKVWASSNKDLELDEMKRIQDNILIIKNLIKTSN